jgi:C4-dicarboxylate-specific signal transduction histidine kinase
LTTFELVDVNKVTKKALKLINEQLQSHGINVQLELQKNLPKIYAHATPMEQVIINLVVNAMHSLDNVEKRDKIIIISTIKRNENCILEITDNGPGIPEENINNIFDPFFTTKVNEEGMGLGLTIIQNFVNSFGGSISAKNSIDGGAVFTVSIPVASSNLRNNE